MTHTVRFFRELVALAWVLVAGTTFNPAAAAEDPSVGERIYREGVLPSGAPLRGERTATGAVEGRMAACQICHRRSGLGSAEGRIVVPPIIGHYLFRPRATNVLDLSLPHVPGYRSTRDPYTPATLARAIREGVDANGRVLSVLMPRYALDDASIASLSTYLEGMSASPVRGVGDDVLHFATIVTPDADPVARRGMLEVMRRFFDDKNEFIRGGGRRMHATREIEYRVMRRWQLHVWELSGAPQTWEAQLRAKLAAEPVFAVISGLGGRTWAPVHRFCEAEQLPCLFPNVDLPDVAEQDFYPVYFSRGVLLEADLMAGRLLESAGSHNGASRRIRQVVREGDLGPVAAQALCDRLALRPEVACETRVLPAHSNDLKNLGALVGGMAPNDVLALWLRPGDLARLPAPAPTAQTVFVSGLMGGLEHAPLPSGWRGVAQLTYPFDLPDERRVRMNFPLTWFKIRGIEVVAERVQTDTYVALGILSETLRDMLDSFVPDYLVERVEVMLSHRLVNGYYPRLSLAQGQRFASKGGYLVRLADDAAVVPDGEWQAP